MYIRDKTGAGANGVIMLGAYGGRLGDKSATSLLVNEAAAIDAGNLLSPLGSEASKINHIFFNPQPYGSYRRSAIFDRRFLLNARRNA
ncbi:MAG: hypothetical protein LBI57_01125 [Helicobacteraceae bacterium]|nr:hypothetical protein [Helicobacteraceae bacterium]